jgi:hypothetical protein
LRSSSNTCCYPRRKFCSKRCKILGQRGVSVPKGTQTIEERFWKHVQKSENGCWLWTGYRQKQTGYGLFGIGSRVDGTKRPVLAHRWIYEHIHGPLPGPHVKVCHQCDNPPCVRDEHMFSGTQAENIADMIAKGRRRSKLSKEDASEIRRRRSGGLSYANLASEFDVSFASISRIVNGQAWM